MELRAYPIIWNSETIRRVLLLFIIRKWGPSIPLFKVREGVHRFIVSDKKNIFSIQKEELFGGPTFTLLERCAERMGYAWKGNIQGVLGKFSLKEQMKLLGVPDIIICGPKNRKEKPPKFMPECIGFSRYWFDHKDECRRVLKKP